MPFSFVRRSFATVAGTVALLLLAACVTPPPVPAPSPAPSPAAVGVAKPAATPPMRVLPVEAEPVAPATQAALAYVPRGLEPVTAMLFYADRLRPLGAPELAAELTRLGDPGDSPTVQMQVALVLAQTRSPADLTRALGLMQRVAAGISSEAQPLQPLARALAARYIEQRRVEDDRDRQAQQVRDSQRRIDQLNERIEALRAIERSFARPNHILPSTGGNGNGRPGPAP